MGLILFQMRTLEQSKHPTISFSRLLSALAFPQRSSWILSLLNLKCRVLDAALWIPSLLLYLFLPPPPAHTFVPHLKTITLKKNTQGFFDFVCFVL